MDEISSQLLARQIVAKNAYRKPQGAIKRISKFTLLARGMTKVNDDLEAALSHLAQIKSLWQKADPSGTHLQVEKVIGHIDEIVVNLKASLKAANQAETVAILLARKIDSPTSNAGRIQR